MALSAEPPLASQDVNQGACDGEAKTLEGISGRGRRRPGCKSGNESIPKSVEQNRQEARPRWPARIFQPIWRGKRRCDHEGCRQGCGNWWLSSLAGTGEKGWTDRALRFRHRGRAV